MKFEKNTEDQIANEMTKKALADQSSQDNY